MEEKFELVTDYQPTGDQPRAIAKLTAGLKAGQKEQTLLGVTGSGKSVVGSSKVLIVYEGQALYIPLKHLDGVFSKILPASVNAAQTLEIPNEAKTMSFNPSTGLTEFMSVNQVSRHYYNGEIYKVVTSCGRSNQFTDSHNVFVLRSGKLELVASKNLSIGDFLPIPKEIGQPLEQGIKFIDIRDWIQDNNYFVKLSKQNVPSDLDVSTQKLWRLNNKNERLSYEDYLSLKLPIERITDDTVGSNKKSAMVPVKLEVSRQLWRFIGLYIAEGHSTGRYITLSTGDETIAHEFKEGATHFGLKIAKRIKKYDYQISGLLIAQILTNWCGATAYKKHLPIFWPQCNNRQLGELLSGIYAGDGGVESNCVSLSSVSKELLSDIQCALLRFGIHGRLRTKKVTYKNDSRNSWVLTIYGINELRRFQEYVGFGLERKDKALAIICSELVKDNTNVDIFPLPLNYIKKLLKKYNMYQHNLARVAGITRPAISLYLAGHRSPSRKRARAIFTHFLDLVTAAKDEEDIKQCQQLVGLTMLAWTPINKITTQSVKNEVVYDLSVPATETFFAGEGGYFVHNTFTMANVISSVQKPTLILAHNKTLAAQLFNEFKNYFPNNAVHYFVSYFDYYQPEAYIARSDTYIEKDSQINEEIDRLRHAATSSLLSRRDVIIVASVSCIYGIGSVEDYGNMAVKVRVGERRVRDKFLRQLTDIQYHRNDIAFTRGNFRVRGDVVDVFPSGEEIAYRIEFFGDDIDRITQINPLTGEIEKNLQSIIIFPGSHYVTPQQKLKQALGKIQNELEERLQFYKKNGQYLESQRIAQRTKFDLEMMEETGFVKGIENYSRYLTNREPGEQPATLMDYFPDDYLLIVDESHMTLPQVRGMYNGDRARKEVLVEHGFRLPSALDNRPLTFTEFERHINQAIYVSATPAEYELSHSSEPIQQVIRPTGLLDPKIIIRPVEGQVDDLIAEIRDRVAKHQRVLVTTLTKRMAEDLTDYLKELNIKVEYLHSDVDTLERTDILRDLRLGVFDVLVGINLLREGLDLPEVSLVAILDADKEGFLRSGPALIQTIGRAARHVDGTVVMYADHITKSMKYAIDETNRRRKIQEDYNTKHNITPVGIIKNIDDSLRAAVGAESKEAKTAKLNLDKIPKDEYSTIITDLTSQMDMASANLEFEKAADLRDLIAQIKAKM